MNQKLNWTQFGEDNEFTKQVKEYIDAQPVIDGAKDMNGFDAFMDKMEAIKIKSPAQNVPGTNP